MLLAVPSRLRSFETSEVTNAARSEGDKIDWRDTCYGELSAVEVVSALVVACFERVG
jgi:hypothetical protein